MRFLVFTAPKQQGPLASGPKHPPYTNAQKLTVATAEVGSLFRPFLGSGASEPPVP